MVKALLTVRPHLVCFLSTHQLEACSWQSEALWLCFLPFIVKMPTWPRSWRLKGGSNPRGEEKAVSQMLICFGSCGYICVCVHACIYFCIHCGFGSIAVCSFMIGWKKKNPQSCTSLSLCFRVFRFTSPVSLCLCACVWSSWPPAILADATSSWSNMSLLALSIPHSLSVHSVPHTEKSICPY